MPTLLREPQLRVVDVCLALALLVVIALTSSSCGGQPGEPSAGTIAYLVEDTLAVVDDDGTNHRRLAQLREGESIAWSPDGRRMVAFYSPNCGSGPGLWWPSTGDCESPAHIVEADGRRRLIGPSRSAPQWSPDGGAILIDGRGIMVVKSNGLAERRLGPGFNPMWSPDGMNIAFVRHERLSRVGTYGTRVEESSLYVVRRDGSGLREIARTGTRVGPSFGRPVWSPDGQSLAFVATRYGDFVGAGGYLKSAGSVLYVVDRNGSHLRRIARSGSAELEGPRGFDLPVWLPHGKTLLVLEFVGPYDSILHRVAADGSRDSILVRGVESSEDFAVHPDDDRIAVESETTAEIIDLDDGSRTKLDRCLALCSPIWSPDGQKLAYIAPPAKIMSSGGDELRVMDGDGSDDHRVLQATADMVSFDWIGWRPPVARG